MKKTLFFTLLTFLLAAVLISCGKTEPEAGTYVEYDNTITVEELSEKINNELSVDLIEADPEYVTMIYSDIDFTCVDSFKIFYSASSIDQYGILKAKDENEANMLLASVNGFVDKVKDTWMTEYDPADTVKIENALAVGKGNYVIFSFLSNADSDLVVDALDSLVKVVG